MDEREKRVNREGGSEISGGDYRAEAQYFGQTNDFRDSEVHGGLNTGSGTYNDNRVGTISLQGVDVNIEAVRNQLRAAKAQEDWKRVVGFAGHILHLTNNHDYDAKIEMAHAYYMIGVEQASAGRHRPAINLFTQAIGFAPLETDYYAARADAFYQAGEYDQAASDYNVLLQHEQSAESFFNRGTCYYHAGKHEQAVSDFNRAIQIEDQVADYHLWKANSLLHTSNNREAISSFNRSIELDPSNGLYYTARAKGHADLQNFDEGFADGDWLIGGSM